MDQAGCGSPAAGTAGGDVRGWSTRLRDFILRLLRRMETLLQEIPEYPQYQGGPDPATIRGASLTMTTWKAACLRAAEIVIVTKGPMTIRVIA